FSTVPTPAPAKCNRRRPMPDRGMSKVPSTRPPHRIKAILRTGRFQLAVVLIVALFQGLLYLFLLPPWQHYDEPTHFEYACLLAARSRRPEINEVNTTVRREVAASILVLYFYYNLLQDIMLT